MHDRRRARRPTGAPRAGVSARWPPWSRPSPPTRCCAGSGPTTSDTPPARPASSASSWTSGWTAARSGRPTAAPRSRCGTRPAGSTGTSPASAGRQPSGASASGSATLADLRRGDVGAPGRRAALVPRRPGHRAGPAGHGARPGGHRADAGRRRPAGLPAYLETASEANVGIYGRLGFEPVRDVTMPDGGPTCWLMRRDPRPVEVP